MEGGKRPPKRQREDGQLATGRDLSQAGKTLAAARKPATKTATKTATDTGVDPRWVYVAVLVALTAAAVAWHEATVWATSAPPWPVALAVVAVLAATGQAAKFGWRPALAAAPAGAAAACTGAWVTWTRLGDPDPALLVKTAACLAAGTAVAIMVLHTARRDKTKPTKTARRDKTKPTKPARRRKNNEVRDALTKTGIAALRAPDEDAPDPVGVSRPVREGEGDTYTIELPPGTPAAAVITKRDELASALRRAVTDIDLDTGKHAGQLVAWLGAPGAGAKQAGLWPERGTIDPRSVFDPIELGLDKRGTPIAITMPGESGILLGAIPRKGKSATMNLIVASLLRDPRLEAWIIDLKGGADFTAWKPCAREFFSGKPTQDPGHVLAILEGFAAAVDAKYAALPAYQAEKISDELASEPGLNPMVLVLDEAHEILSARSGFEHRDRAIELVQTIISRAPAVNAWLLIASQRVTSDQIPTEITDRISIRVAFRLATQPASQAVLGEAAWRLGFKATECPAPGVGFIATEEGVRHLRAWFVPGGDAYALSKALAVGRTRPAVGARPSGGFMVGDDMPDTIEIPVGLGHGWRSSEALEGVEPGAVEAERASPEERGPAHVADRVAAVWETGATKVHLDEIADALGVDLDDLVGELRDAGAPITRVSRYRDGGSTTKRGLEREPFDTWRAAL